MSVQPYKTKIPKLRSPKFIAKYPRLGLTPKEKQAALDLNHELTKWHSHPAWEKCEGATAKNCAKSPFFRSGE